MNILKLLLTAALLFLVWYIGAVVGYIAGRLQTRKDAQQQLDAWAADTGSPRIRLKWDGDGHDPEKR